MWPSHSPESSRNLRGAREGSSRAGEGKDGGSRELHGVDFGCVKTKIVCSSKSFFDTLVFGAKGSLDGSSVAKRQPNLQALGFRVLSVSCLVAGSPCIGSIIHRQHAFASERLLSCQPRLMMMGKRTSPAWIPPLRPVKQTNKQTNKRLPLFCQKKRERRRRSLVDSCHDLTITMSLPLDKPFTVRLCFYYCILRAES